MNTTAAPQTSPAEQMLANLDSAEAVCRDFAAQHPTPNVLAAIGHCESGRLAWTQVAALFERSLSSALTA